MDNRTSTQNKRDLRLAQMRAGLEPNGHKGNMSEEALGYLMEMKWSDCDGLTTTEFFSAMLATLGKKSYNFWLDNIAQYIMDAMRDMTRTEFHHGRYHIIAK